MFIAEGPAIGSFLASQFSKFLITLQTMASTSYQLFCMGNPLLDMQVKNGEELLKKYNLKANDAILAGEEHMPM